MDFDTFGSFADRSRNASMEIFVPNDIMILVLNLIHGQVQILVLHSYLVPVTDNYQTIGVAMYMSNRKPLRPTLGSTWNNVGSFTWSARED